MNHSRNDWGNVLLGNIFYMFDFSGTTGTRFFGAAFFIVLIFLARLGQGFVGHIFQIV